MNNSHERIPQTEALREIGWNFWDPLNLRRLGWKEQGGEDEYDGYLRHIVKLLEEGASQEEAIRYLIGIEGNYMEMDGGYTASLRATMTVGAISALISKEVIK